MENDSIELKFINRFVNGVVEFLKLLFGQDKVVSDHFFKECFTDLICVNVFVDDMTYVFNGVNIMNSLVLLMVFNTALSFTYGTGTGTCDA